MNQNVLKKAFYPYSPAMVNSLEIWLSKKASAGWRLESMHGWIFLFRKCKPYNARFFSYSGFGTSIGISNDYWASKNRYAHKNSAINKSNSIVYEVDIKKIDSDFNSFVLLRNKFYLQHYWGLLLFALVFTILALYLMINYSVLSVFLIIGILLLAYSSFSVLILIRQGTVCVNPKEKLR